MGHFEELELSAFNASGSRPYELKQAYLIKRRASVFKRMSRSTLEIIPKVFQSLKHPSLTTFSQDLLEKTEAIHFYSDELLESTYHLMDLQLSIASQKTNERMRILTLFSVFLLPLTVITGIYGMNFEHMPELKLFYGYPYALGLMGLTILSVFLWFKRKGFLS